MTYTPNAQHRSAAFAHQKSQWQIPVVEEISCYQTAKKMSWIGANNNYWGIYVNNLQPDVIGVSPLPNTDPLHIAKFVSDANGNWHGYPVATWLSPYDKPPLDILQIWHESSFIKRASVSKIHRGKKCSL